MKARKLLFCTVFVATVIVIVADVIGCISDAFVYDMKDLPAGTLVASYESSAGSYTLDVYKVTNSLGSAIRGRLKNNKTASVKNVYWETSTAAADVFWLNDELVSINGNVVDITADVYDSRRPIISDSADALLRK